MEVFTFCPPSGLGDIIVITPSLPIFKKPLSSVHSLAVSAVSLPRTRGDAKELIQLKLIINPPPAKAEDFKKVLLLIEVCSCVIALVFYLV
jgi:hypothetical protein